MSKPGAANIEKHKKAVANAEAALEAHRLLLEKAIKNANKHNFGGAYTIKNRKRRNNTQKRR